MSDIISRTGLCVMIVSLFRRKNANGNRRIVADLYQVIVDAGRQPHLFAAWGLPDTPLGRYESIALHMILFLHRTKGATGALDELATAVVDEFFLELDHSIRELGVGDAGVPKRMKKLGKMFYGRMGPYWQALDDGDANALEAALARNIDPESQGTLNTDPLARYMIEAARSLKTTDDETILSGRIVFPTAGEGA